MSCPQNSSFGDKQAAHDTASCPRNPYFGINMPRSTKPAVSKLVRIRSSLTESKVRGNRPTYATNILAVLLLCLTPHLAHATPGNAPVGGGGSCSYSTEPDGTVAQQQPYDNGLYTCLSSG